MSETCCERPTHVTTNEDEAVCVNCGIVARSSIVIQPSVVHAQPGNIDPTSDMRSLLRFPGTFLAPPKSGVWKTMYRLNLSVQYSCKDRIRYRLIRYATDIVEAFEFADSDSISRDVTTVLSRWVCTNGNNTTNGRNRKGIVAFCVYRSAQIHGEPRSVTDVCVMTCIKKTAFHTARKRMYCWFERELRGSCDRFFQCE